jgi:hypothetical protein
MRERERQRKSVDHQQICSGHTKDGGHLGYVPRRMQPLPAFDFSKDPLARLVRPPQRLSDDSHVAERLESSALVYPIGTLGTIFPTYINI